MVSSSQEGALGPPEARTPMPGASIKYDICDKRRSRSGKREASRVRDCAPGERNSPRRPPALGAHPRCPRGGGHPSHATGRTTSRFTASLPAHLFAGYPESQLEMRTCATFSIGTSHAIEGVLYRGLLRPWLPAPTWRSRGSAPIARQVLRLGRRRASFVASSTASSNLQLDQPPTHECAEIVFPHMNS